MKKHLLGTAVLAASLSTVALTGCQGSAKINIDDEAELSLSITDGPIDEALEVNIEITEIRLKLDDDVEEVKSEDDESEEDESDEDDSNDIISIPLETPLSVNLLDLQGAESETVLENIRVPASEYEEVRFILDPSGTNIVTSEGTFPLRLPGATSSGLKLKGDLDLLDGDTDITIDFDLRQSIKKRGDEYRLKPVVRIVNNEAVGALSGQVISSSCDDQSLSDAAMYLYTGDIDDDDVDDYGSGDNAPIASALLDDQFKYEFGFLPVGEYQVALVCDAANDVVEDDQGVGVNDSLEFDEVEEVKIRDKKISIQNFPDDDEDDDDSAEGREDAEELDGKGRRKKNRDRDDND